MATPPPTTLTGAQQQQQHQVRRLTTIRQFQERQRQRHEECLELRRLLHRCEEDAELEKGMLRGDAATLAEFAAIERRVEQGIEATRKYLPASAPELAIALNRWAMCLQRFTRPHLVVSLLLEVNDLLKDSTDPALVLVRANALWLLGSMLHRRGRLEEAEAVLLQSIDSYEIRQQHSTPSAPLIELADVYFEAGRYEQALRYALAAERALKEEEIGKDAQAHVLATLVEIVWELDLENEYDYYVKKMTTDVLEPGHEGIEEESLLKCLAIMAREELARGTFELEQPLGLPLLRYKNTFERGFFPYSFQLRGIMTALRLLVQGWRLLGKAEEAQRLELDLDETQAILDGLNQAALAELQGEMQEERAAATAAAAAAGGADGGTNGGAAAGKSKKPSRKQQKRKAAQRRKAEAPAAAEAAAAEAAAVAAPAAGDEQKGEDDAEGITAAAAAAAAAATTTVDDTPEPEPEPKEPEPEPEVEPEECAICLNDLPPPGAEEGGGVLLACSHVFHAECLGRWKDKCLEKGLRFTCAMCRGAVVVVSGGAEEGEET